MDLTRFGLEAGNYAFFWLHTGLIVFNLTAWAVPWLRMWQLISMLVVTASWFAIGPLLGHSVGYCLCTDWHFQIREDLGYELGSGSYTVLLAEIFTGWTINENLMDVLTGAGFILALVLGVTLNVRDFAVAWRKSSPDMPTTSAA